MILGLRPRALTNLGYGIILVLVVGLEPTRHHWQRILNPPRLPFQHTSIFYYGTHFWVVN